MTNAVETGYVPVGDLNVYYEIYGDGGFPLLLLHGGLFDIEQQFGALIPALHRDPDLTRAFQERFIGPKLALAGTAFDRARLRGEVGAGADLAFLARILPSMATHEMFVFGTCVTREHVTRIVDEVVLPACRATLTDH